jgi:hypothetical protein
MPKSNLPARSLFGSAVARQDRRTASEVGAIHAEMFVERARDAAQRDLAILKMSDIAHVGRHGMAEAADVANCVSAHIEANPISAKAVTQLAETTVRGLERELRRLTKEG